MESHMIIPGAEGVMAGYPRVDKRAIDAVLVCGWLG